MTDETITFEQLEAMLPKTVTLVYISRGDSLDHNTEALQKCIHENDWCPLDEDLDSWVSDASWDGVKYVMDELRSDLEKEYEFDDGELDALMELHEDDLRDAIYERDDSTVIDDLLRESNNFVAFYDTGHYVECGYPCTEAQYRLERYKIKKLLGIPNSDHDKDLYELMANAGYGGQLLVYFRTDVKEFVDYNKEPTTITFRDAHIAIVDHSNGSGFDTTLPGHTFTLPFNRENVFLDKEVKYSYTYDVCGMSSDWCDGTSMTLGYEPTLDKIEVSPLNAHMDQQNKYDEVYKAGGCTFGDMKYTRHRDVKYRNEYPCGSKCPHCGTFWID